MTDDLYRARNAGPWDRIAKVTHCVDCLPGSCPMNAFVKDGVVVREESSGDIPPVEPGVPDMNPLLCQKGLAWSRQLRSPDRLLHPMRRVGERGSGEWEVISWEEALDEVAEAIRDMNARLGLPAGLRAMGVGAVVMLLGGAMGSDGFNGNFVRRLLVPSLGCDVADQFSVRDLAVVPGLQPRAGIRGDWIRHSDYSLFGL